MRRKIFERIGFFIFLGIGLNGLVNAASATNATDKASVTPPVIKLEPKIRPQSSIVATEHSISTETLRPFLSASLIFENKKQFDETPYVVAQYGGHAQEGGPGAILYVRGIKEAEESIYNIYKDGKSYKHPVTGEMLGFEALTIGTAELQSIGDVAQFRITKALEWVENNARLLPNLVSTLPPNLHLQPAKYSGDAGFILSVRDGISQVGRNQVVLISLGKREGMQEGNILNIYQTGKIIPDPASKRKKTSLIRLPDVRIGSALVFQTHEKLSLALVLEAKEVINLLDKVKSP